jgi:large subunit ribosomal protein L10
MTREEKVNVIAELSEKLAGNKNFYITDASGFTVAQINQFRRMCFDKGLQFKVYKNTLIKKALDQHDGDYSSFDGTTVLKGYSGIIFSPEIGNLPAKVIKDYRKKGFSEDKPALKAASIDSEVYIGEEYLSTLSELKSGIMKTLSEREN